jgi:outer membrane protein TolC
MLLSLGCSSHSLRNLRSSADGSYTSVGNLNTKAEDLTVESANSLTEDLPSLLSRKHQPLHQSDQSDLANNLRDGKYEVELASSNEEFPDALTSDPNAVTAQKIRVDNVPDPQKLSNLSYQHPTSFSQGIHAFAPRTIDDQLPREFWNLSLDEAIEIGLQNTTILKDLGGRVLQNPQSATSVYEPGLQANDPVFGVEAALAQFDAQLRSNTSYQNNDQVFNNQLAGGGAREVQQDLFNWNVELRKTIATGTQFSLNRLTQHDNNNAPANLFDHSWTTSLEATIRQPLLQGGGVEFNRIAGPNALPGFRFTKGVVVAQIEDRITINQFQQGVQDYLDQLIISYWQLYLAYRNYEAAIRARDTAYETWRIAEARFRADLPGGEADREAQAREQMLTFDQQVLVALSGDQRSGQSGVYQAEANLRRLLGMTMRDENFIKPSDVPYEARVSFDWNHLTTAAATSRLELLQQQHRVKQRELELVASKNFLLPRLDAFATYRMNGFGDDLIGGGSGRFASAAKDYYSGDHQESEMGLQLSVPLGYRREYAGLRHAQLNLQRERSVLDEQKQHVYFQLANAVRQASLDYQAMQNAYNRMVAADQSVAARFASFEADRIEMDFLLEAQQRRAQAESNYHQSVVNYQLSQFQVQTESGNLLDHLGVVLSPNQFDPSLQ